MNVKKVGKPGEAQNKTLLSSGWKFFSESMQGQGSPVNNDAIVLFDNENSIDVCGIGRRDWNTADVAIYVTDFTIEYETASFGNVTTVLYIESGQSNVAEYNKQYTTVNGLVVHNEAPFYLIRENRETRSDWYNQTRSVEIQINDQVSAGDVISYKQVIKGYAKVRNPN